MCEQVDSPIRILHFSSVRKLSAGQRKQLRYEVAASRKTVGFSWESLAVHTEKPESGFEKRIPVFFRPIFLRNLYSWLFLITIRNKYDYIIFRHIPFDPFVFLFALFFGNRITIHHSKEIEEMVLIRSGWKGVAASYFERLAGRFSIRSSRAVLGVTNEIARYEIERARVELPSGVYPNAIDLDTISLASDDRCDSVINVVFICGKFMPWHGLDLLAQEVKDKFPILQKTNFKVHLVGGLSSNQERMISEADPDGAIFAYHGYLSHEKYARIMAVCDVGLGSLAMYRQGLKEGATLKVRELLAMGLPVYSGHRDASLPEIFPYYKYEDFSVLSLCEFASKNKVVSRLEVRNASAPLINKLEVMNGTAQWLEKLFHKAAL